MAAILPLGLFRHHRLMWMGTEFFPAQEGFDYPRSSLHQVQTGRVAALLGLDSELGEPSSSVDQHFRPWPGLPHGLRDPYHRILAAISMELSYQLHRIHDLLVFPAGSYTPQGKWEVGQNQPAAPHLVQEDIYLFTKIILTKSDPVLNLISELKYINISELILKRIESR